MALLVERALYGLLSLFLIYLPYHCGLRVLGCRPERVGRLLRRQTLRGLLGFIVQLLLDFHVQGDDCVAEGVGLLLPLKQLEVDFPRDDFALRVLLQAEHDSPESVRGVEFKVNFNLDDV